MQNMQNEQRGGSVGPGSGAAAVKVAVIVPAYNVEDYVFRAIESVLAQSHCAVELILVDDGATDGSLRVCNEMAERDERIRVLHRENGGCEHILPS